MENEDLIMDVDLTKRSEEEWEDIYHVHIKSDTIEGSLLNEFEWAFKLCKSNYYLKAGKNNSYEVAEQMEMRGMKINRDLHSNADKAEKKILLSGKYMPTKYVMNYTITK